MGAGSGPWSVAVADADQYVLLIAGVPISQGAGQSGYDDGEWFSAKPMKPSFTTVEGADGSIMRSATNSRLMECSLNLLQTSNSNPYLSGLLIADENTQGGAGIGSLVLKDLQGTTLLICSRAWIGQWAEMTFDRGGKGRKWPITAVRDSLIVGGN
jgi:Protein of unknown function (DUF3277)